MKEKDILKIYNNYCIIGMSPDPEKYSYQIYQCLKNAGKHVYGISPKYDTIDNDKIYTSLMDIEYPVDVVVFVVNKTIGMTYIREMRELGIKYAWMQQGTECRQFWRYARSASHCRPAGQNAPEAVSSTASGAFLI